MQKSQKIRGCWIERTPFASSVMTAIIVFLVRFANGFDISGRHQCVCVLHGPRIQPSQKVLQVNNSVDLVCTSLLFTHYNNNRSNRLRRFVDWNRQASRGEEKEKKRNRKTDRNKKSERESETIKQYIHIHK